MIKTTIMINGIETEANVPKKLIEKMENTLTTAGWVIRGTTLVPYIIE